MSTIDFQPHIRELVNRIQFVRNDVILYLNTRRLIARRLPRTPS